MVRTIPILASVLFVGCASAPTSNLVSSQELERSPERAIVAEDAPEHTVPHEVVVPSSASGALAAGPADFAADPSLFEPALPTPLSDEGLRNSRVTIKGGLYSSEDAEELDDGYIVNLSWMRFFSSLLALELEAGYFTADGDSGGIDGDVWGVPLMLNGRANLPVWILDVYGGLGAGGIYYDAEAGNAEDDGVVLGGNAFVGATINLADALALGLEAKYYATEDIDEFDSSLDAFALMLTLGFSR